MCQFAFLDPNFSVAAARTAIAEAKESQKFWYGDFHPLSPCTLGPGALIAYQSHRSDLNAGIVLAFRRGDCPYPVLQTSLRGLDPKATYRVEFIDEARRKGDETMNGRDLTALEFELRLPKRPASLLVRYQPLLQQTRAPKWSAGFSGSAPLISDHPASDGQPHQLSLDQLFPISPS